MFDGDDLDLPGIVIGVINELCEKLLFLHGKIASYSLKMTQVARREKRVALLQTIPLLVHWTDYSICNSGYRWNLQTVQQWA